MCLWECVLHTHVYVGAHSNSLSVSSIASIGVVIYAKDANTFVVMKDLFDHVSRATRQKRIRWRKNRKFHGILVNEEKAHLTYVAWFTYASRPMELVRGASIIFACFTIFSVRVLFPLAKTSNLIKHTQPPTHTHTHRLHLISYVFIFGGKYERKKPSPPTQTREWVKINSQVKF